uniref:SFRICE_024126 n=1 Tax=Spodoptera frugiperda TaxID=7108 RepID=A0A2H1VRZ2_SPOFR
MQSVAPCENRTRYTLRDSQLPRHRDNRAVRFCLDCLAGRVILGLGKVLLGFFENFSVVAQSLDLYPVYGKKLVPYYMGLITQMVKSKYHADCLNLRCNTVR